MPRGVTSIPRAAAASVTGLVGDSRLEPPDRMNARIGRAELERAGKLGANRFDERIAALAIDR